MLLKGIVIVPLLFALVLSFAWVTTSDPALAQVKQKPGPAGLYKALPRGVENLGTRTKGGAVFSKLRGCDQLEGGGWHCKVYNCPQSASGRNLSSQCTLTDEYYCKAGEKVNGDTCPSDD